MTSDVNAAVPPAPPRKKPRKRRWWLRAFGALLVLLVLIVAGAQVVFDTELPRNIVINVVQRQLGLRVTAKTLSTGWFGHTELTDVTLSLPLAEEAFLTAPRLDVSHTWLPWLLLTRSMEIKALALDRPHLVVRQTPDGRWNLQDVAQLVTRAGGAKTADANAAVSAATSGASPGIPKLPKVDLTDASVQVIDNAGRTTTVTSIALSGYPDSPLSWTYRASVPDHLDATGRVAPGDQWRHTVRASVARVGDWLTPWVKNLPEPLTFTGRWEGRLENGLVAGRLDVEELRVGPAHAAGPVLVSAEAGIPVLRPQGLRVAADVGPALPVVASGGSIHVGTAAVELRQLTADVAGGAVVLDGKTAYSSLATDLSARWTQLAYPRGTIYSGDATVHFTQPFPGQPEVHATLDTSGSAADGSWDVKLKLDGGGTSFDAIDLAVTAPQLTATSKGKPIDLSGLAATLERRGHVVSLARLSVPREPQLAGRGSYDLDKRLWWFVADGRGLTLPDYVGDRADLDLNAWGDRERVRLENLYLRIDELVASANGNYVFSMPKPVDAHLYVMQSPEQLNAGAPGAPGAPASATTRPAGEAIVSGSLWSEAHIDGSLTPASLEMSGLVHGRNLAARGRKLGDVDVNVAGRFDGREITVVSRTIELLGGHWTIGGDWPAKKGWFDVDLSVGVEGLSLAQALDRPDVSGTLDGRWNVDVSHLALTGVSVDGRAKMADVRLTRPGNPALLLFAADTIDAQRIALAGGQLKIDPIKLARRENGVDGRAAASISLDLAHPDVIDLAVNNVASWPYAPPGAANVQTTTWASGKIQLDAARQAATGGLSVHTIAGRKNQPSLADLTADLKLDGRAVRADSVSVKTLGGEAHGNAAVAIDRPLSSTADFTWTRIDAAQLAREVPRAKDLRGTFDGLLHVAPARGPRPLAPLEFDVALTPRDASFRSVALNDLNLRGFVGADEAGRYRAVLDDAPGSCAWSVAGGRVSFWGRVTQHVDGALQSIARVDFDELVLKQLSDLARPDDKPLPGRVGGSITVVASPQRMKDAYGTGYVTVARSDIGNSPIFAVLYNLMNLQHDPGHPTGEGRADLRLEGSTLTITSLRYFNAGVEIRAAAAVADVFAGGDSPISGNAVGSPRPFRDLKLPLISDVDKVIAIVGGTVATVNIGGTVKDPKPSPTPFASLGEGMKSFILGDVKSETQNSAQ